MKMYKKLVLTVAGVAMAVLGATSMHGASAQAPSLSGARDCDNNAVIHCGGMTTTEIQNGYKQAGVAQIYNDFGISSAEVASLGSTAVAGQVNKNGDVVVNGKVVATNAVTAGRENIAGSTKVVSGGVTYYKRAPSVSFVSNSISAFVVMKDGQFQFAILSSCGNPVVAKPVPQPKPQPEMVCNLLQLTAGKADENGNVEYTLIAQASAKNATIASYTFAFGDGKSGVVTTNQATATTKHVYAPGDYTASVVVVMVADGKTNKVTGPKCTAKITVAKPNTPVMTCDQLQLTPGKADTQGNIEFTFNAKASATNATITAYTFTFGDGKNAVVTTDKTTASTKHTYAPGTYTANVSVAVTANGKSQVVNGDKCVAKITVAQPPTTPETPPTPPIVETPTPEVPAELPNTGAGDVLGLAGATSVAGTAFHRVRARRNRA